MQVVRFFFWTPEIQYLHCFVFCFKDWSGTAATSKMEHFVIIASGWKPLPIIPKSSILDVTAVPDLPLAFSIDSTIWVCFFSHFLTAISYHAILYHFKLKDRSVFIICQFCLFIYFFFEVKRYDQLWSKSS